jgi:uncharacterized protein (TIGR02145 family)
MRNIQIIITGSIFYFSAFTCLSQNIIGKQEHSLADSRDSIQYRTIKLAGATWMQENLAYNIEGSDCYDHNPQYCKRHGRLYTYEQAQQACPEGWALPDNTAWESLIGAAGGDKIAGGKLKAGGLSGFEARMAGYRQKNIFTGVGHQVGYWSASGPKPGAAFIVQMYKDKNNAQLKAVKHENFRMYVRCVSSTKTR